jgi:hypothetical protein
LFTESFDAPGFTSRGWYDIGQDLPTTAAERRPGGSQRSLQWTWPRGAVTPSPASAARRLFTPTDRVYLSYWVKYSSNWVGSGLPFHPHEFNLLTTEDGPYSGLAFTRLTVYAEHSWRSGGGVPVVAMQDGVNIDQGRANQNLVTVTENRSVHGCNGIGDNYGTNVSCYRSGASFFNGRSLGPAPILWTDTPGPNYKSDWHRVELYVQMNTIRNGVGQADGVIRYWFDGRQIMDLSGVMMRTARYPNMRFNQLVLGPFMGEGSPVNQTAWFDDLIVATGRVP